MASTAPQSKPQIEPSLEAQFSAFLDTLSAVQLHRLHTLGAAINVQIYRAAQKAMDREWGPPAIRVEP